MSAGTTGQLWKNRLGKLLPSATPPSPMEMVLALGGPKPSGDPSKAPWGVGSYRQRLAQGLVTAWWPVYWAWGAWSKPGAKHLPSSCSQLTAMHFSKAVILSCATSSLMATYM